MAIPARDLMKVQDVPEVATAIQARDEAMDASREAYKAWKDADRVADQRQRELEVAAAQALLAWRREA